jgi:predicted Zn-dependent protease
MKFQSILSIVAIAASLQVGMAQNTTPTQAVYFKAMEDEMARSLTDLKIGKYQPPFLLSYRLTDGKTFYASATLGAITSSNQSPTRDYSLRLLMGNYDLTDENFVGSRSSSGGVSLPMPLDDDYASIRKALWSMTDRTYKSTVETYEQKLTALKQQNETDEPRLPDFTKVEPVQMVLPSANFDFDVAKWEETIKALSAEFSAYPDFCLSNVAVFFSNSDYYYCSSEGAKVKTPNTFAIVAVNAGTLTDDGEMLGNQLFYTVANPTELPSKEVMAADIRKMADFLVALRKAPVVKEAYSGPVVVEGAAAADIFDRFLFSGNGLITTRDMVYASDRQGGSNEKALDSRIGHLITSRLLTVKETPTLKSLNGKTLIGSYEVDGEGVVPPTELTLIEKGFLRNMLNDRVPTSSAKQSNGHYRVPVNSAGNQKAPSVTQITVTEGTAKKAMYKGVAKQALKNDLTYFYVVRQLGARSIGLNSELANGILGNGGMAKPIAIYRVNAKTLAEELVRPLVFSDMTLSDLKNITMASKETQVQNYLNMQNGMACSMVLPQAIVFDDITMVCPKNKKKQKLPVVPSPLVAGK